MTNPQIENKLSRMVSELTPIQCQISGHPASYEPGEPLGDAADFILKAQFYLNRAAVEVSRTKEVLEDADPDVEHAMTPIVRLV